MGAAATTNAGATTQDARQAAGGVETAVGRVRRMTVATVGVLFRADASKPLNARDGASLIPAAERAIRAAAAQGLELFLITHVRLFVSFLWHVDTDRLSYKPQQNNNNYSGGLRCRAGECAEVAQE